MKELNQQERVFVAALLRGSGKREAAIEAGYAKGSAHVRASELLGRPHVKAYLQSFHKRSEDEVAIDRERIRQRMIGMALAQASDIFEDDWSLKSKSKVPPEVQALVLNARTWDSPDQGSGSSAKLLNQLDAMKAYLKFFPPAPTQAETLEGAAAEVDNELDDLITRLKSPDDVGG